MPQGSDSSAISLESFVASALNEFDAGPTDSDDAAQPDSSHDAPGAPPVEPSTTPSNEPSDPEGEDDGQDEIDPSAPPAPDSAAPDAPPEDDPLAGIAPFTYTVNGQSRTFDDIQVIPGKGAVISDAALSKLQQRFSERDTLFEKSQQQYKQYTDLERLTAWTIKGQDGKEQVVTGREGLQAHWIAATAFAAENKVLKQILQDPAVLRSLIDVDPQSQSIVHNQTVVEHLNTKIALERMQMEQAVRGHFQGLGSESSHQQEPDVKSAAPGLIDHFATQFGISAKLTDHDKASLARTLPRFIRDTTPEDIAANPALRDEPKVIDAEWFEEMRDKASRFVDSTKTVEAVSAISKENAAKLAAAAAGKTQVKSHVRNTPQRQAPQPDQRAQDAEDAFAMMQRASAGRF